MGIYTKTGDKGTTSLFDGTRVEKTSDRVNTYGTFDECNSHISLAEKLVLSCELKEKLIQLQHKIFFLSAEIATEDLEKLQNKSTLISSDDIKQLEDWIDTYSKELPEVKSFVLPGRSLAGAQLHIARTVCRRAERCLLQLSKDAPIRNELLIFTNRLSDCLYMFARVADQESLIAELTDKVFKRYEQLQQTTVNNIDNSNFSLTQNVLQASINKALELNIPVTISLVDKGGNLILSYRMPEAILASIELSQKKAYTAVAMKSPTHQLQELTQPGNSLYQLEAICAGKLVTFGGGLPLYYNDTIVGGIGVSGGTVEQDIAIAQAGKLIQEKGV